MGLTWRIGHEIMNVITPNLPLKHVRSRAERPIASISFDDFPKSAWTVGGSILAEYGVKGTYYTAGGFCGITEDGIRYWDDEDLRAAHSSGHEIACHSFSHARASTLNAAAFLAEAAYNASFVSQRLGRPIALAGYAYPQGDVSPLAKALASRRYASARGVTAGVNKGWIDLAQLRAIPIEIRRWRPKEIDRAIARAAQTAGWLIFFTHDVDETPTPFGCTPDMLCHLLDRLKAERIELLPVKHAMARAVFGNT
jgi:peptidoglycan/xylan/chitin deacetylase (PgdA/CDA1 family)